jgi:hypothetical protein
VVDGNARKYLVKAFAFLSSPVVKRATFKFASADSCCDLGKKPLEAMKRERGRGGPHDRTITTTHLGRDMRPDPQELSE